MITYTQQDYLNTLTKAGLVIDSNLYGHDSDGIQGLTYNSKEAAAGTLFVCKGAAFHPQYLADAVFPALHCMSASRNMNWIQKFLTSLSLISEKQCHTWENSFLTIHLKS